MKHFYSMCITGIALAALTGCGTLCQPEKKEWKMTEQQKIDLKKAYDFLKSAETYYIATVEGDQPRVRPFGTVMIYEDRLYIQTGKKKNVSKQIAANGKVELCAFKDGKWIRVTGTLVNDDRIEPQEAMLKDYPSLKNLYAPGDGNNQVLYFDHAAAVISSFTAPPVTLKF